jgi:hypothetical protein
MLLAAAATTIMIMVAGGRKWSASTSRGRSRAKFATRAWCPRGPIREALNCIPSYRFGEDSRRAGRLPAALSCSRLKPDSSDPLSRQPAGGRSPLGAADPLLERRPVVAVAMRRRRIATRLEIRAADNE